MPHGSYKSITDVTRDLLYFSFSLSLFFLFSLSLSLCFPLPKLRAIMKASIFHLVPSARPYCLSLSLPLSSGSPRLSLFSLQRNFFLPASSLLSPVIGRLLMARDCLSRLSGERRSRVRLARIAPISATFALRDRVGDTREPILTFHFSRRGSTFGCLPSFACPPPALPFADVRSWPTQRREISLSQAAAKGENFLLLSLSYFPPRPLYFPLPSI